MNAKTVILLGAKVIALTIVLVICFMVGASVAGVSASANSTQVLAVDPGAVLLTLLIASFLESTVCAYLILRSRWTGWKLVGAIFFAFYGIMTVVMQVESIVFLPRQLPPGMIPKLFLMGAVVAALFSPSAVLILGKMRRTAAPQDANARLVMSPVEWVWKLVAIAIAYEILYFTFGYFVAWKNPAVQAYYGGTDPGDFLAQIASIWQTTPWMFLFQAFRAMLWTLFVLPVIRMFKGPVWETSLAIALFFAVWSSQLLLPNPYMPAEVAWTHLIETASSNFIFGGLVGWLLSQRHHLQSARR